MANTSEARPGPKGVVKTSPLLPSCALRAIAYSAMSSSPSRPPDVAARNAPPPGVPAWATGVCSALAASGVNHVVYVPDNPLSHLLGILDREYPRIRQTLATREEEAVGVAAGLYLGGQRCAVLMQSSGLGNCANALASLLVAYQIPAVFIMSMRGDPGEWNWAQVPLGRAVRPILDALGVLHLSVERAEEAEPAVRAGCESAFSARLPTACLLARRLTTPAAPGSTNGDGER
jgi:sulfopyruvate decarboxylase alpha subunit